jgi:acyl-CoA thioesterase I
MHRTWVIPLLTVVALAFCGCGGRTVAPPPDGIVRIMPLGDSITQGRPEHPSYRTFLWKTLASAGYKVDFIGSVRGSYEPRGRSDNCDPDHEGHWAFGTREILAGLPTWLNTARPQVVLVHLGSKNIACGDRPEEVAGDISRIIATIRRQAPGTFILLAEIIPIGEVSLSQKTRSLNVKLRELARKETTRNSPILVVDQEEGFLPNLHTYDGVHPNEEGAKLMANRFYAVLARVLPR